MTRPAHAPPLRLADSEEAVAALRDAGCRVSTPRRLLLDALFAAAGPVAAEYIARGGRGRPSPGDVASVYRNLELFERLGIVRHLHAGHGPGLYSLAGRGAREHLYCERCGRVQTLEPEALDAVRDAIRTRFGFEAHFAHFPIVGLCADCATAPPGTITARRHHHHGGQAMHDHDHEHDEPHSHEHDHDDHVHAHPHDDHDHGHVEHEHEHSHGDRVHSHPHVHQEGLEERHDHGHDHEPASG